MMRLFTLFLILFLVKPVFAQLSQMRIEGEPQKSPDEIVAVRDPNGRFCAAIQVISDMDGFSYQSYNGVVEVDDQPGKDMVYLQPDERVLEVYKSGYQPLKIILSEVGIQLKQKVVWKIQIKGSAKTDELLPVTFFVEPQNAIISVDGKSVQSGISIQLTKGEHLVRIRKQGYKPFRDTITVTEDHVVFPITLSEVPLQKVVIQSTPQKARIYVDNVEKGLTDRGLFLYPGQYQLKLSKTGHLDVNDTIQVTEGGNNTFSYTLVENVGILALIVQPSDAKILINKEDYSGRSEIALSPGRYKIEISKSGYNQQSETITIKQGQKVRREYNLTPITGRLRFNVQPLDASVTLTRNGKTIERWQGMNILKNLPIGDYTLTCSAVGYTTVTRSITIKKDKIEILDVSLQPGVSGKDQYNMVLVEGGTFQMGSNDGDSDEQPVHTVTLSSFEISKYEITNAQYCAFLNDYGVSSDGSYSGTEYIDMDDADCQIDYSGGQFVVESGKENYPVIEVTWYGAKAFCEWAGGRLPTEAEWEYAARGGNQSQGYTYSGSNNLDEVGWYGDNSGGHTHLSAKIIELIQFHILQFLNVVFGEPLLIILILHTIALLLLLT